MIRPIFSKVFFLLVGLVSVSQASHSKMHKDFDKPKTENKISLGKSPDAEGDIIFNCWNYELFAVIQVSDPALVGAKDISIRYKAGDADLCAEEFAGREAKLTELEEAYYFKGAKKNFLFFDGTDSFGTEIEFAVASTIDGKKIFSDTRDLTKKFSIKVKKLKKSSSLVSLNFHKSLKVSCPLAQDGKACWEKVLAENEIPASLKLQMPDCKKSFKKAKSALDNKALVATPVKIDDLAKPQVKFQKGQTTCNPVP